MPSGKGLWDEQSLVQRGPADCGISECGREASTIKKRPWPTRGCKATKIIKKKLASGL